MPVENPAPAPAEAPETPVVDESTVNDPETPDPGAEALSDPGKQALDRMKAAKREAEQKARDTQALLDQALAKIAGKEAEFAAEQERRNVESAALAKANDRIRRAEVRAAASGVLADPKDALLYLDLDQIDVSDDGEVDSAAVAAAVADLVKSKPYLAAQGGPRTPAPDPSQGPRTPPSGDDAEYAQYAAVMKLPSTRK